MMTKNKAYLSHINTWPRRIQGKVQNIFHLHFGLQRTLTFRPFAANISFVRRTCPANIQSVPYGCIEPFNLIGAKTLERLPVGYPSGGRYLYLGRTYNYNFTQTAPFCELSTHFSINFTPSMPISTPG